MNILIISFIVVLVMLTMVYLAVGIITLCIAKMFDETKSLTTKDCVGIIFHSPVNFIKDNLPKSKNK